MGWSSGTPLALEVINAVKQNVPDVKTRIKIYRPILEAFTDADWDNVDETMGQDEAWDYVAEDQGWVSSDCWSESSEYDDDETDPNEDEES